LKSGPVERQIKYLFLILWVNKTTQGMTVSYNLSIL
jgi:hypothetical protein